MAKDILIDDEGDLVVTAGDFKIGDSDSQHIVLLVNTMLGSWKQSPTTGIGIIQYSASSGQSAVLKRNIMDQLAADGFVNSEVLLRENGGAFDYYITAQRLD